MRIHTNTRHVRLETAAAQAILATYDIDATLNMSATYVRGESPEHEAPANVAQLRQSLLASREALAAATSALYVEALNQRCERARLETEAA